jgi:hypothetical protein
MTQNVSVQPSERAKNTESILFFQKGMTTELLLLRLLSMDVVDTILGSKKNRK